MALGGIVRAREEESSSRVLEGLSWRALAIAILLTIAGGVWVRQAEIVVFATQVSESVPVLPALAALFLLLAVNWLLRRVRAQGLTRVEILTIYTFVAIAVSMVGVGVVRYWLSLMTYPFHFATTDPRLTALQQYVPTWMVPHQTAVIEGLYYGTPGGVVPWRAWLVPLAAWSGFFVVFWFGMLCMMVLVRRRWLNEERLSYPIAEMVLEITSAGGRATQRPFFRNPVMWVGFSVAFLINGLNIVRAFHPAVPGLPLTIDYQTQFSNWPWLVLQPVWTVFSPLVIGLGFLVSTEISLSIWFFVCLYKLEALFLAQQGYETLGLPFPMEQCMGAFLFLGLGLLWAMRGTIRQAFRGAAPPRGADEPMSLRTAVVGLVACSTAVLYFFHAAGMATWVAGLYLAMLGLVALGCARVRAEAGIPLIWAFPYWMQKKTILYTLGTAVFTNGAYPGTLTALTMFTFLSRGYFPALIGYQADAFKLAQQTRMRSRDMAIVGILAVIVGLGVGYYIHFTSYYRIGAGHLYHGIWGWWINQLDFVDILNAQGVNGRPDVGRIAATGGGFVLMAALTWLRRAFFGFPLHPLGFAIAMSYGHYLWFPFLVVWLAKSAILRWGGMRVYREAIPAFLGFALGHVFTAGVVWGLLGAIYPAVAPNYAVTFG